MPSAVGGENPSCTFTCDATHACPVGYTCDSGEIHAGYCASYAQRCDTATPCPSGQTCVNKHCAATCDGDAGSCPMGLLCVSGGCVIDRGVGVGDAGAAD
jgi:hypothetical protein